MEGVQVCVPRHGVEDNEEEQDWELEQGLLSLFATSDKANPSSAENSGDEDSSPMLITHTYTRRDPTALPLELELSLLSCRHSLWGHKLWNAAKVLGEMIDSRPSLIQGKYCLELGAGAALPSLLAALNGARRVVCSDYATSTDRVLVKAMQTNIDRLVAQVSLPHDVLRAVGYVWGQPIDSLLAPLQEEKGGGGSKFQVILCADLIFNRSEHKKLLWTCKTCLEEDGEVLVTYSHHDPGKRALDMAFFALATQEEEREEGVEEGVGGWIVEDVKTEQHVDLFVESDGLDEERGKVYVKRLRRRRGANRG